MGSYDFLAGSYDALTTDVDYPTWADYIERHFARLGRPVRTVLDLACGTGSLTCELAGRGYEVTGVDKSPEMLSLAEEKCRDLDNRPRFFCEGMEALRLPGRVDACVCCLDSVNYVLQPRKLERAFRRVYDCLEPGGLFLFDADTPEKLAAMDGQVFLDAVSYTHLDVYKRQVPGHVGAQGGGQGAGGDQNDVAGDLDALGQVQVPAVGHHVVAARLDGHGEPGGGDHRLVVLPDRRGVGVEGPYHGKVGDVGHLVENLDGDVQLDDSVVDDDADAVALDGDVYKRQGQQRGEGRQGQLHPPGAAVRLLPAQLRRHRHRRERHHRRLPERRADADPAQGQARGARDPQDCHPVSKIGKSRSAFADRLFFVPGGPVGAGVIRNPGFETGRGAVSAPDGGEAGTPQDVMLVEVGAGAAEFAFG